MPIKQKIPVVYVAGPYRAHGNHDKCSKARQAEMAELRAREKE